MLTKSTQDELVGSLLKSSKLISFPDNIKFIDEVNAHMENQYQNIVPGFKPATRSYEKLNINYCFIEDGLWNI